ncbi:DMT family transporter [Magnetovibrio sp. PR-2]|uniref:DMT family transporter n=1 Tax=Magnetovibrio sp. PR-2 TaxID=3120356 RepID=UPI002FCE1BAD
MTQRAENLKTERLAFVLLMVGAACIAFAPIFVRLSELGPTATAFHRMLLAMPALWLWLKWGEKTDDAPKLTKPEYTRLALAGFFFAGDMSVWHFSIHYTSVANSTLLANLAPIFVTLFGFVLFKDRVSKLFVGGMVLALLGAVTLMSESLELSEQTFFGDILGVITAVFYASYILAVGRLRARMATRVIMYWSTLFCAGFLGVLTALSGEVWLPVTFNGWGMLIGLALVAQVFGQGLIAYALAHLPASFGSVSLLFQPVIAALAAWVIFSEALGPLQGIGAAVVLAGVVLARQGSLKQKQRTP